MYYLAYFVKVIFNDTFVYQFVEQRKRKKLYEIDTNVYDFIRNQSFQRSIMQVIFDDKHL